MIKKIKHEACFDEEQKKSNRIHKSVDLKNLNGKKISIVQLKVVVFFFILCAYSNI